MTKREEEVTAADADPWNDDELIDNLLEHNVRFRQLLKKRLKEKTVSVEEARKRLA